MTTLTYNTFTGRHWETGAVHNFLAHRGFNAPHTGQPYSEALLLGVSGGAVMGYFSFAYKGYDPMCRILTRNTFNPLETMLSRLGVAQNIRQTTSAQKGTANLLDTLASGEPAIVWADACSLPYNALPMDDGMWMMAPVLVYGLDEEEGTAWLADRAAVPLKVTADELLAARARVKKYKFRLITLSPPNPDKLASAVTAGIWDCINLYTEDPPKGSKNNFGLQAYRFWMEQLTRPKARLSWAKVFPPGRPMFAGLLDAYHAIHFFDGYPRAGRDLYADFLEEARLVLDRPALSGAGEKFREAGRAWDEVSMALLPDSIEPFREAREAMHWRHALFVEQGGEALEEIQSLEERLRDLKAAMASNFPLSDSEVKLFLANLADKVGGVLAVEEEAVSALREAVS